MGEHEILDSWKEISAYLKRSERTCQRLGLPVHRLDGSPRARVFAYRDELDAWLAKKVDEREHRKRPLFLYALGTLGVSVAVVILIWRPWPRDEGPPLFSSDRPSIAILNLANRTGEEGFDQYRDVLSTMISDDLSQSKYIYVVPPDQVNSILTRLGLLETETFTTENLRAIGRRGIVKFLASGYYAKAGERFLIRLTIQEAESGKVVGTAKAQGAGLDSLFALADEITPEIKPHLELTAVEVATDIDSPLERVMTSSMEAYKYYLQGMRLGWSIKFREAIEMLEKAVAIDTEFAMAYRLLGAFYINLRDQAGFQKNTAIALDLSNRLGRLPLREKLLIEAQTGSPSSRIKTLSHLLELYPDDRAGNNALGQLYGMALEEFEKAAERYFVIVRTKPDSLIPYANLAVNYHRMGEYHKAENVLKDYIREFQKGPGVAAAYYHLSDLYRWQGKYKLSLAALEEASRLDPSVSNEVTRRKGWVFHLQGKFAAAEAEYRKLLSDKDVWTRLTTLKNDLSSLYLSRGMFRRAKETLVQLVEQAEKANQPQANVDNFKLSLISTLIMAGETEAADTALLALGEQAEARGQDLGTNPDYLYQKATVLLKKKAFVDARATCAIHTSLYEKNENKKLMRYPLRLQGEIELEMGNYDKAVDRLTHAKSLVPGRMLDSLATFIDPLALTYFRRGDLERARQEYETITRLTTGRITSGDIYARSFYMLGQIYEQLGKKKQARANYHSFLELWKDADPGLPEVDDAKTRLAALK
jgi:tetratricopeptide (TPR) repeat protein